MQQLWFEYKTYKKELTNKGTKIFIKKNVFYKKIQ